MNSLLFYAGGAILVLIVLSFLPALKHLVKPVIESIWKAIQFIFTESGAWVIWLAKMIFRSHLDIVKHLIHSKEHLDPTSKFEDRS